MVSSPIRRRKKIKHPDFDVYTATWPSDYSEMSQKNLVLYFDKNEKKFPFPYWIQTRDGGLKFKIRAIDSGEQMYSPVKNIPRRPPIFKNQVQNKGTEIVLSLIVPSYYCDISLYAFDITNSSNMSYPITFNQKRFKENVTLTVKKDDLQKLLLDKNEYQWVIVIGNHPKIIVKSPFTFKWTLTN